MTKWMLTVFFVLSGGPAFAADHLDCMSAPLGSVEQNILDRHYTARRGEDRRSEALSAILDARAKSCGYLYNWSAKAVRFAAHHRWLQIQWKALEPINPYTSDEEVRLDTALMQRVERLVVLFKGDVDAVSNNTETPPPVEGMFREFHVMIREAKISQKNASEQNLDMWLYRRGSVIALEKAFERS